MRHGLAGWSLRGRLLAGILALLAVVCLGIGAVSTIAVRQFLIAQLDGSLASAAMRAEGPLRVNDGAWPPPSGTPFPPGQAAGTISYVVLPDGTTMASVLTAYDGPVPLTDQQREQVAAVPMDDVAHTATVEGLGDYRLIANPRCLPSNPPFATARLAGAGSPLIHRWLTAQSWLAVREVSAQPRKQIRLSAPTRSATTRPRTRSAIRSRQ